MDTGVKPNVGAAPVNQIVAAVIGNALEWYDFVVYGFLTVVISRLFFPAASEYSALLLTTATFGVGFFMRPVGGIVLGIVGDRRGRKAALQLIIALMTVAVAMIAFAPTYAMIGMAAPMIILLARLLQGFATGGEFANSTAFLIESAPTGRRGLYGSYQMVGQGLAALFGATAGWSVTHGLAPGDLDTWGWRIPFLLGLLIGPVGFYIRRHLKETDEFEAARAAPGASTSFGQMLRRHPRQVLVCMGVVICGTVSYYVVLVYMPTFANRQLHIPLDQAFLAQIAGLVCLTSAVPIFGALSDRIGRKPVMLSALGIYFIMLYPLFAWLNSAPTLAHLVTVQVLLCSVIGAFFGPTPATLAEQFPAAVRTTGMSLAYNLAVMLFGGFAQSIVTWLIKASGSPIAPVFYLLFGCAVGIAATSRLVERPAVQA